jgi:tetratricopeptide (TPR) repeat protein/TolB-like protein
MLIEDLVKKLQEIPVPRKFVVLDFCRSGAAIDALTRQNLAPLTVLPGGWTTAAVLAACARDERTPAGGIEPSLTARFTEALLRASQSEGGYIPWINIVMYVRNALARSTIARPVSFENDLHTHPWNRRAVSAERLAVLPFECNSERALRLADGFAVDLVRTLRASTKVAGWLEVRDYRPPHDRIKIAAALGSSHIISGTFDARPKTTTILVEVFDARNNDTVISISEKKRSTKTIHLIESVARQIVSALKLPVSPTAETAASKPAKGKARLIPPQAVALCRDAYYHWSKRSKEGFERAIGLYQQASAIAPDYALPYAGIANSYLLLAGYGYEYVPPQSVATRALQAAHTAVAKDSRDVVGHTALAATIQDLLWDIPLAEQEYRVAAQLAPYDPTVRLWLGLLLLQDRRKTEALEELRQAEDFDPYSSIILANLGFAYGCADDLDAALRCYERLLQREPRASVARYFRGQTLAQYGQFAAAANDFNALRAATGDRPLTLGLLAYSELRAGHIDAGEGVAARLMALIGNEYVSAFHLALVALGHEDYESAIRHLWDAVEERSTWVTWYRMYPLLQPLFALPAFMPLAEASQQKRSYELGVAKA